MVVFCHTIFPYILFILGELYEIRNYIFGEKMSFSKKIADEVLVKSGRRCSICNIFCGTKIELHHIKPKYQGGEDIFDNCIPLCFNCHADVGSYNFNHPKGKKYSEKELKMHREKLYEKMVIFIPEIKMNSIEWISYANMRFGYIIKIPSYWPIGEEATNGDGIQLYDGNPDIDIRVWGAHTMFKIERNTTNFTTHQRLHLHNGIETILYSKKENNKVIHAVYEKDDKFEYCFLSSVTSTFFKENESILYEIIKSFDFIHEDDGYYGYPKTNI